MTHKLRNKLYTLCGLDTPHLDQAIKDGHVHVGDGCFAVDQHFFPQKGMVMEELRRIRDIQIKRAFLRGLLESILVSVAIASLFWALFFSWR